MTTLYHYTCQHGRDALGDASALLPPSELGADPTMLYESERLLLDLVWLTDLDTPDRAALGLTSKTLICDRTVYRYRFVGVDALHWPRVRRSFPAPFRRRLESVRGVLPMHWWLAPVTAPVVFDPFSEPT